MDEVTGGVKKLLIVDDKVGNIAVFGDCKEATCGDEKSITALLLAIEIKSILFASVVASVSFVVVVVGVGAGVVIDFAKDSLFEFIPLVAMTTGRPKADVSALSEHAESAGSAIVLQPFRLNFK